MRKIFLAAGAALGAGLAGPMTGTPTPAAAAPAPAEQAAPAITRHPTPQKPAAQPAAQRQVTVRAQPGFADLPFRFIEKPGRRKVKYGKHRWVIV